MIEKVEKRLKICREEALLGNYKSAIENYEEILSTISEHVCSKKDSIPENENNVWNQCHSSISRELRKVEKIQTCLKKFNIKPSTGSLSSNSESKLEQTPWPKAKPQEKQQRNYRDRCSLHEPRHASTPIGKAERKKRIQPPNRNYGRKDRNHSKVTNESNSKFRKKKGEQSKGSYSELMQDSIDIEIIKDIENTLLSTNLDVSMHDIAGAEDAKGLLDEAIVLPTLVPNYFKGIRRPWKGILLFGPPGTGKTMLAKACAADCNYSFFSVPTSALSSKWRGESEKRLRILFDTAQFYSPSMIFFDEIDSIGGQRGNNSEHEASRRVKTELLVQMDGISPGTDQEGDILNNRVVVLAATNLPWELDEALRRRLEKRIYIPLPNTKARRELFRKATSSLRLADDVDFDELADISEGYSGADLTNICRDAAMMPLRRLREEAKQAVRASGGGREAEHRIIQEQGLSKSCPSVCRDDFIRAFKYVQSSVGTQDLEKYRKWESNFGAK